MFPHQYNVYALKASLPNDSNDFRILDTLLRSDVREYTSMGHINVTGTLDLHFVVYFTIPYNEAKISDQ